MVEDASRKESATPEAVVFVAQTANSAESGQGARSPHALLATCFVAFALSIDPLLWMMGIDIPTRAFGAGWVDYRTFTTTMTVLRRF